MWKKQIFTYLFGIAVILLHGPTPIWAKRNSLITPAEMIINEGFPTETHLVTTEDGYILTLNRIPGAKGSTPVFLLHGLLESSADFLYNGKNGSLAFLLHQMGYDVWLANSRGNTYSKMHTTLSINDPLFWDFGWDELGLYDNPAAISYVYNQTNEKMFFVGHSLGCATFAVTAIERPDIAKNIKGMFSLAPAVYATHNIQPLYNLLSHFWKAILFFSDQGMHEFFGRNIALNFMADYLCPRFLIQSLVCDNLLFLEGGFDRPELPKDLTPKLFSKFPAGSSVKLFVQYLQQVHVAKFRRFNYPSTEQNLKVYNSRQPPEYDITKIQVPVAVFYSSNDWIVGPEDAKRFYEQLPQKLGIYKIDPYNHFDFIIGRHAPERVYSTIFKLMSQIK